MNLLAVKTFVSSTAVRICCISCVFQKLKKKIMYPLLSQISHYYRYSESFALFVHASQKFKNTRVGLITRHSFAVSMPHKFCCNTLTSNVDISPLIRCGCRHMDVYCLVIDGFLYSTRKDVAPRVSISMNVSIKRVNVTAGDLTPNAKSSCILGSYPSHCFRTFYYNA